MTRLSCKSLDAALTSTAALLGTSPAQLEMRLRAFTEEQLWATCRSECAEPHEILVREALGIEVTPLAAVPEVVWFHATRAEPGAAFDEGLLPTDQIAHRLEARLVELARDVSERGDPCIDDGAFFRLHDKLKGGGHAGPFAFLIRDVAMNPSSSRDFTRKVPEVVEELAFRIDRGRSQAICAAYHRATRRCIVSFVARQQPLRLLGRAVYYAYIQLRGEDPEPANANYAGNGHPVPASDIIGVDFLD